MKYLSAVNALKSLRYTGISYIISMDMHAHWLFLIQTANSIFLIQTLIKKFTNTKPKRMIK